MFGPSPDMSGLSALTRVKSSDPGKSGWKAGFQRGFSDMSGLGPDMSGELYDHCILNSIRLVRAFFGHVWVLAQLCHLREISSVSGLSYLESSYWSDRYGRPV
jgi:hypothetical protein